MSSTLREDYINNGVNLLVHPNVQGTPLSELVAFLEKKGLTSSEIDEALKRAESKLEKRESSSGPTSSEREKTEVPQYSQESQRENGSVWSRVVGPLSALVGVSAASALAYQALVGGRGPARGVKEGESRQQENGAHPLAVDDGIPRVEELEDEAQLGSREMFAVPSGSSALELKVQQLSSALEQQNKDLRLALDAIRMQQTATQSQAQALKDQLAVFVTGQTTSQAISDIRAELSSLKTLLSSKVNALGQSDTRSESSASDSSSKSTSRRQPNARTHAEEKSTGECEEENAEENEREDEAQGEKVEVRGTDVNFNPFLATSSEEPTKQPNKREKLSASLKTLLESNPKDKLRDAASMLLMYVKNLVEYPDVPRYRRISTINQNFKDRVAVLKDYLPFMESIGFRKSGAYLEWMWHTAKKNSEEALEIQNLLKDSVEVLGKMKGEASTDTIMNILSKEPASEGTATKVGAGYPIAATTSTTTTQTRTTPTPKSNNISPGPLDGDTKSQGANDSKESLDKAEEPAKDKEFTYKDVLEGKTNDNHVDDAGGFMKFVEGLKANGETRRVGSNPTNQTSSSSLTDGASPSTLKPSPPTTSVASSSEGVVDDTHQNTTGKEDDQQSSGNDATRLTEKASGSEDNGKGHEDKNTTDQSRAEPSLFKSQDSGVETHSENIDPNSPPGTTNSSTTGEGHNLESDGPTYPKSFAEVMELVQSGKEVPGIKKVEDKLSMDADKPSVSAMEAPPKPWSAVASGGPSKLNN